MSLAKRASSTSIAFSSSSRRGRQSCLSGGRADTDAKRNRVRRAFCASNARVRPRAFQTVQGSENRRKSLVFFRKGFDACLEHDWMAKRAAKVSAQADVHCGDARSLLARCRCFSNGCHRRCASASRQVVGMRRCKKTRKEESVGSNAANVLCVEESSTLNRMHVSLRGVLDRTAR